MAQDNISNLYNAIKDEYDVGSEEDFRLSVANADNRKNLYDAIKDEYDVGSEEDFEASMGYGPNAVKAPEAEAPAVTASLPTGQAVQPQVPQEQTPWRARALTAGGLPTTEGAMYDRMYKDLSRYYNDPNAQEGGSSAMRRLLDTNYDIKEDDPNSVFERNLIDAEGQSRVERSVGHGRRDALVNRVMDDFLRDEARAEAETLVGRLPESGKADDMELELQENYYQTALQDRLQDEANRFGVPYGQYLERYVKPAIGEALRRDRNGLELPESALSGDPKTIEMELLTRDEDGKKNEEEDGEAGLFWATGSQKQLDNVGAYLQWKTEHPTWRTDVKLGRKNNSSLAVEPLVLVKHVDGSFEQVPAGYDEELGRKLGDKYVTENGSEYDALSSARTEQSVRDNIRLMIRQIKYEQSEDGELKQAYEERDRLNEALEKRTKELSNNEKGSALRYLPSGYMSVSNTTGTKDAASNFTDTEFLELFAAKKANDERIRDLEAMRAERDGTFVSQLGRSIVDYAFNPSTWDGGITDFIREVAMLRSKTGANTTEREKEAEQSMLENTAKAEEVAQKAEKVFGNGYKWGRIAAQSLPFAMQFMAGNAMGMMGGITRGGRALGVRAARRIVMRDGSRNVLRNFSRSMLRNTGVLVGDLGAAAALSTTLQAGQTTADVLNRYVGKVTYDDKSQTYKLAGGKSLGRSIYEGVANSVIENYTELLGEHIVLGKFGKWALTKIGLGKVSEWFTRIGKKGFMQNVNKYMKMGGFNGYPQEVLEEEIGIPLNALFVGDSKFGDLLNGGQQMDIAGGMLLSMAAMGGATMAMAGARRGGMAILYQQDRKKVAAADKVASMRLTAEKWSPIKGQMDDATNADLGRVIAGILGRGDLSIQEKEAVWDYAQKLINMRGHNLGEVAAVRNGAVPEGADAANSSYTEGYNTEAGQKAFDEAKGAVSEAQRELDAIFGEHTDPMQILTAKKEDGTPYFTKNDRDKAQEVVNARLRYEGMARRVRDDIEDAAQQAGALVDSRTNHDTGKIQQATLQGGADGGERTVYIVGGRVATAKDGSIDAQGSDMSLVVVDERGRMQMVSPDRLSSVEAPVDGTQAREAAMREAEQEKAQEIADNANEVAQDTDTGTAEGTPKVPTAGPAQPSGGAAHTTPPDVEAEISAYYDARTHEDTGMLQPVVLKAQDADGKDRTVYVVQGRVATFDDGTIDVRASDPRLIVVNENGEREMMSPDKLLRAEEPTMAALAKRQAIAEAAQGQQGSDPAAPVEGGAPAQGEPAEPVGPTQTEPVGPTQTEPVEPAQSEPAEQEPAEPVAAEQEQPAEGAGESGEGAENAPMPMRDGEEDWAAVTPERAHAYLFGGEAGLSRSEGNAFVAAQIDAARKRLKKEQGQEPKMGTSIKKYKEKKAQHQGKMDEAQATLDYWQRVKSLQDEAAREEQEAAVAQDAPAESGQTQTGEAETVGAGEEERRPGVHLTEEQANQLLSAMEEQAEDVPEIELTPQAWSEVFDENNSTDTPIGRVKMGDGQITKFLVKGRTKEFGMVGPTLKNPDVILEEPSEAKDGHSERGSSYVFVKTFNRNGEKIKFYASITVKQDGMEVSISSHYMNKNAVSSKMQESGVLYIRKALLPNSSEWHLAEQQNAVPDLLPTQGNDASQSGDAAEASKPRVGNSTGKGSEKTAGSQTKSGKTAGAERTQAGESTEAGEQANEETSGNVPTGQANKTEEPAPVGKGPFGNIYDQFKGKAKEAFTFLMKLKEGDLLGVFHREDVGDIDLVWGDENGGLAHILSKHVGKGRDFESTDEAFGKIEEVLKNGTLIQDGQLRYVVSKDGYRVAIRKDYDGNKKNWIVTAIDYNRSEESKGITTNPTSASHGAEGSELAVPRNSTGKGSEKSETAGQVALQKIEEPLGKLRQAANSLPDGMRGKKQITGSIDRIAEKPNDVDVLNEIARMESNLSRMDDNAETGSLKQAVAELKAYYEQQGYDVPTLLGAEYDDGFLVDVEDFKIDDKGELGVEEKRITSVKKPQIIKDGQPVQKAKVIVTMGPSIGEAVEKVRNGDAAMREKLQTYYDKQKSRLDRAKATGVKANWIETEENELAEIKKVLDGAERTQTTESEGPSDEKGGSTQTVETVNGGERVDSQGNPLNDDGTLKIEKIGAIDELTDGDFEKPTRTVQLPQLPANVDAAIGANGKPVIIKKNIFEKNRRNHPELTSADGRSILHDALYTTNLYGQTQPKTRSNYWVVIHSSAPNRVVILEVSNSKDNIEIIGWRYAGERQLEELRKQAEREDGQLLILTSKKEAAAGLSTLPQSTVSTGKGRKKTATERTAEGEKQSVLQGFYKAEPVQSDFSADSGYMRNAEKKAVKDVNGLFKALVKVLGIADPTVVDAKGKKQKNVTANIAPVGGDIVMRIPLGAGYELNMRFGFEPAGDVDAARDRGDASPDSLVLNAIRYRVEDTGKSGQDKYVTRYYEIPVSTNLENMLGAIRKVAGNWLPRQERAGGKMTAEEAAAAFPFTRGNGRRYKASAIKTDEQGERYVVQYEGEKSIDGTSLERKLTVKNAPAEATMVFFSPNGVVPIGYAAWDEATGEYKVWDMDGKPVQIVREERAGSEATALTEAEVALRDAVAERMRQAGIETSLDDEEGQRVLDLAERAGEPVREMGNHHSKEAEERNRWRRAYDVAKAFVTGRTPSQVKADRQEAERQWKKKTQNLFDAVLRGEWNDATLQLIEEYISDVTPDNPYYHPLSRRLPSRVLRTLPKGERTGSVDALFSRISESAVPAAGKTVAERRRAVQAKKEELLRGWADATGHWHTDVRDFTDDTTPIGSGKDSEVYRSRDGQHVIKVSKGKNEGRRFISDPDSVALFNSVFRDTSYKILGYGEIDGKFVTFLEQPTVDFAENAPVSVPERVEYMAKRGFKPVNKAQTAFSNGTLFVADVQKGNIVKDKAGNIRVIDADVKLHTKDIGGEYTYPPVETDLQGSANRNGGVREMRAYHGSGARFDVFDSSHMGEGEGAQAHGHGHYVAVKEGTARGYGYDAQRTKNAGATVFLWNGEALNGDDAVDAIFESTEGLGENRFDNENRFRVQRMLDKLANGETKKDVEDYLRDEAQDAYWQGETQRGDAFEVLRTEVLPNLEINEEETASRYLYSVEIPENKGGNYIEEGKEYSPRGKDAKRIKQALYNHLIEHDEGGSYDSEASRKSLKKEIDGDFGEGLTGRELYRNVAARLGSDEAASAFLHDLGYKGIHYYGRQDGECYVVFDDADLTITDRVRFFRGTGGEVLGFTVGGRVYLDPRRATAETPLHEYTHLWAGMLRSVNPKEWANVVELMKGEQALWEEVRNRYPELAGNDDALAEEVLAHYSGRRGAERLRQEQARIATGTGSVGAKARAIAALERLKAVLGRFWHSVGDLLGLHFTSAEEVADQVLGDLARGVNPTSLTPGPSPVGRGENGRGGRIAYSLGDGRDTFNSRQRKAVQDKGTVMPGLNGAEVHVVDVPRHDFAGTGKQALQEAESWAKANIVGTHAATDGEGNSFEYKIGNKSIEKYVSSSSTSNSDNAGVHLAVLKKLPEVISNSIEAEEHPDYTKNEEGKRNESSAVNNGSLIHRFYGAANIDGKTYRVKTTIREYADLKRGNKAHNYEVTKIELIEAPSTGGIKTSGEPLAMTSNNSISVAKLLQNVEKSYDNGKKLLDESAKADEDNMLYRTSDEIDAEYPNWLEGTTTDSGKHSTQVAGTRKTYGHVGDWIESHLGKGVRILDASSGMGYGTQDLRERGFNIEDVEPYQSEERKKENPATYSSYDQVEGKYDYIISNAVLNVIPDNWRSDVLHDMAERLKVGGRLFINTRKAGEEKGIKDKIELDSPQEVLVKRNGRIASYQRFFTPEELRDYVAGELGSDYEVEIANERNSGTKGLAAVVVTKRGGGAMYRGSETEQAAGADGRAAMHAAAEELATELGEQVEIVDDVESIAGGNATQRQRRRTAKGWYDPATGRVVVVLANHTSAADVRATVLHEVVGHKGLRALLGEGFDAFLDRAYNGVGREARAVIDAEAAQMARRRPNRTEERCRRAATEEYVARLAEQGFEDRKRQSIWRRIVQAAKDLLSAIRLRFGVRVSDADLRYMLWRSHELASGRSATALGALRDARMREATEREELERRDGREGEDIEAVNERFNEDIERYERKELPQGFRFDLGYPSAELRSAGFDNLPMSMRASLLARKAGDGAHPFKASDLKDLVKALQRPIAIFRYSKDNMRNVIVDVQHDSKHFLIGITLNYKANGIEINSVSGLFPKESHEWIKWIQDGKAIRIDQKEKVQSLIASLRTNPAESERIGLNLDTAAKVVENFENPAMVGEENSDELLYRSGDESGDGVARAMYNERVEAAHEIWREAWQDDMLPVRRMQEAVMAEAGGELKDSENAYIQENNGHGVMRAESEQYELKYYRPLLKAVRDVAQAAGMELRDVERYMMARHGLERNEKFAERDAEAAFEAYKAEHPNGEKTQADFMEEFRKRDYSGLTGMFGTADVETAEDMARALVADVEGRTDTKALWAATNAATKRTLRQSYEDGIISKDTYEKVRDMFSWYVPLRGFEDATAEDLYDYVSGGRTAFSPTLHRAKGRGSEAESPLAYIASMAESAIVQGRKNRTKQAFLQMALNHPTNLLTVSEMWYTNHGTAEEPEWREDVPEIPEDATADEVAAIVKAHEESMQRLAEEGRATKQRSRLRMGVPIERRHVSEHHVEVLVNGKKYVIYVNGSPRAAQALNGTRKQRASEHSFESSRLAELNRRIAQAYTSLSPKFVVRNLIRDYTMATAMTFIKEGPQYALRFQGNVAKLGGPMRMFQLMYLYRNDKLDMSKETQRLFYEFMTQGGETGFTTLKELHDYEKDMRRAYQSMTRHAADPREGVKAVMRGVELANRCIEDMSRFATYMASRQSGKSVAQSVQDAKNITLNFNRKGSGERGNATFRNLFIFVNPAIQAMHQVASAMRHHPGRTGLALGIISMAGMAAPLLVHLLAQVFKPDDGYDPEEAYRQLPAWQRQSNYVLWIPGTHKFLMIPLGQEFRAAHGLGEATAAWLMGRGGKEAYLDVASMVADLLPVNPEGNGWNPLINFLPTMVQPVAQVAFNTDFTGRPIWRETEWNKYDPAYQKAYVGTPAELVAMSAGLNELTGGNAHKQGKLERYAFGRYLNNPAVADHLLSGYFGGLYSFSADLVGSLWRAGQGELPDARELPIVNALVTAPRETEQSGSPKMDDRYYELKEENDRTAHELSGWRGDAERGDTAAAKRYKDFLRSEAGRAYLRERAYMQAISRLRGAAKRTSDAERRERLLHRIDSLQRVVIEQNQ